MSKNNTILKTSKKTSDYFHNAEVHFQNANKIAAECKIYASAAVNHAFNVIDNSIKTTSSIHNFISEQSNNYSYLFNFAQIAVAGFMGFTSSQPEILIGAYAAGAILISPSESIECAKNTVKAGIITAHLAYETAIGLAEGAAGVVSLITDNIYSYDTIELAGINNMIEYSIFH